MGTELVLGILGLAVGGILWWITEARIDVPRPFFAWMGTIFVLLLAAIAVPSMRRLFERKGWKAPMILVLLVGAVFGAFIGYMAWNLSANKYEKANLPSVVPLPPTPAARPPEQVNPSPEAPSHSLLVRYSESLLPITVDPKSVAYVLQLNPNITRWAEEVSNKGPKMISWPSGLKIKQGGPPNDSLYICEVTNHEDKPLLDVSIPFAVSFHQLEMVQVTRTLNKNGTESISIPGPGPDHIIVVIGSQTDPKDLTSARDGELVKAFTHTISLPAILPRETVKIYLINQSKFISKFKLPKEANAIVAGTAHHVRIRLIRPDVGFMDSAPWFGLAPATYHWHGIPGAP